MAPIQTCVLGVGLAGLTFHVPFISSLPQLFTLHSVLERSPKTPGGKLTQRYSTLSAKIHNKLEDVLSDPEIELVVVATPNETHYAFAKAALEAGKHGERNEYDILLSLTPIFQFSSTNRSQQR